MRTTISGAILLALANAGIAAPDYTDTAQVIAATPIIERISEPRTECFAEPANAPAPTRERSLVGPVVGGVTGAVIGNQIGHGSGRTAATAAGAIAGTIIGDRVGNSDTQTATAQPVQRCRTVETIREVVKGYSVVYRYNGRDITTTMPYNPGSVVRVAVGIADGPPAVPPPAGTAGSNVREVSTGAPQPPPGYNYYPPQPPPAPAGNTGGYQYRY